MKEIISSLLLLTAAVVLCYSQDRKIVIEIASTNDSLIKGYKLVTRQQEEEHFRVRRFSEMSFDKFSPGVFSIQIPTNSPLLISDFTTVPGFFGISCLVFPGDSVRLVEKDKRLHISEGSSAVFKLYQALGKYVDSQQIGFAVRAKYRKSTTVQQYLDRLKFYDEYCSKAAAIIETYESHVSPLSIAHFTAWFASHFYVSANNGLIDLYYERPVNRLQPFDFVLMYDSLITQYGKKYDREFERPGITCSMGALEAIARMQYLRSREFNVTMPELDDWVPVYYHAKEHFKGLVKSRMLTKIAVLRLIQEAEFTLPGFEALKDFDKNYQGTPYQQFVRANFKGKYGLDLDQVNNQHIADGPHVLYKENYTILKSVVSNGHQLLASEKVTSSHDAISFTVTPDGDKPAFQVVLKKYLRIQPAIYPMPSKLLAISDIEGNFNAFVDLLRLNHVIDDQYNWIFGQGHLALVGDFVDRGDQVTELLWFIYMLEEKAQAQGGYIHFILGNHEIMNFSGGTRYVHLKYKIAANEMKVDYSKDLYGPHSELGRWLRTKNTMEKIGNVLFLHAGVSAEVNALRLPIDNINHLVRTHYGQIVPRSGSDTVKKLTSDIVGTYWYRGYYKGTASVQQIDSTLAIYDVERIVTGHTIIKEGKTLTEHFNGKVINIDTHHASGYTQGLLIDHGRYYQVSKDGGRISMDFVAE
jgi:hypothetical protein